MTLYSEDDIESAFCRYAVSHGCLCEKLILKAGRGWPDRTLITPNGHIVFIEFKKPTGGLSRQQIECLSRLRKRKIECYVFERLDAAQRCLDQILRRPPLPRY